MIKREKRKVYYTDDIITNVNCDRCGKSIDNENDFVHRIEISSLYFIEDRTCLGSSGFTDYTLDLCKECAKPIEQLVRNIDKKSEN